MKKKRIVISGGPGSGKTTLINSLNKLGYSTFDEYSRTLIEKAKNEGKNRYFLSDPYLFSEALFTGRKKQNFLCAVRLLCKYLSKDSVRKLNHTEIQ